MAKEAPGGSESGVGPPGRASRPRTVLRVLDATRAPRIAMLAVVTAATAFGLGASPARSGFGGLLGLLWSLGGFVLDDYLDRRRDRASGTERNLVASGDLAPAAALWISIGAFAAGAVLSALLEPWALLPMAGIVALVVLPSTPLGGRPWVRAVSLGGLQAMYATVGALLAAAFGLPSLFVALFLFFAMTGGRVMGDVRDMSSDARTGVQTLPIRYGVRAAGVFLLANELAAYACAFAAWAIGGLGPGYLGCAVGIAVLGTGINVSFLLDPTPARADLANRLSLGLLGGLYTVGMFLAGL